MKMTNLSFVATRVFATAVLCAAFWCNLNQAAAVSAEYVWLDVGSDDITGDGANDA